MSELTDADIDAALAGGKIARETELRAIKARYDRRLDRVIVDLTNGCTFSCPRLVRGLEMATDDQHAVEIPGDGYGLHLEMLDADISVPGIMAGRF